MNSADKLSLLHGGCVLGPVLLNSIFPVCPGGLSGIQLVLRESARGKDESADFMSVLLPQGQMEEIRSRFGGWGRQDPSVRCLWGRV